MMSLARAFTQKFSTPTNNRLGTSTNTKNQAVIQDGKLTYKPRMQVMVEIVIRMQGDKAGIKRLMHDMEMMTAIRLFSVFCELSQLWERKMFSVITAMKKATMPVITVPSYDAKAVSEVNASSKAYEQMIHEKRKTIIQTSDDDQIDSNIIFGDPYVENNGGTSDHDSDEHDEYHEIQMLAYDFQREAENQKRLNNELKKQKMLQQKELETSKKDFKEREDRYLDDIVDLEEKLSSHDRIVYKMGQSIQTIHMLGKEPNKVYDPFIKVGLGYKNPERLKKAIAAQQNMYDGELLDSAKLNIDSPDYEETLKDAEKSRLNMRNKLFLVKRSNIGVASFKNEKNESKLLKMFDKMGVAIHDLRTRIDKTLLEDGHRRWMSDSQNSLREFYKTDVISMSTSLSKNLKELKEELIERKC
ncbi:hypothetical protein Tco_1378674 [Tanacetum coccineum]